MTQKIIEFFTRSGTGFNMNSLDSMEDLPLDFSEKIPVTDFTDFRVFLKAYFKFARQKNYRFSYGAWAKKLQTKDTSTLTKIVHGQRDPGPRLIEQLVKYFKFSGNEANYFRSMVQLEKQKEESSLKLSILETLGKTRAAAKGKLISATDFNLISEWHALAIRQLSRLGGFIPSLQWISEKLRFPVSDTKISEAIDSLKKLELLYADQSGPFYTSEDLSDSSRKKFHLQSLEIAAKALNDIDVLEREFTSLTLAFSSSRMKEAKNLIRKFKTDFDNLMGETRGSEELDSVYQFQIQFFPLTRKDEN